MFVTRKFHKILQNQILLRKVKIKRHFGFRRREDKSSKVARSTHFLLVAKDSCLPCTDFYSTHLGPTSHGSFIFLSPGEANCSCASARIRYSALISGVGSGNLADCLCKKSSGYREEAVGHTGQSLKISNSYAFCRDDR